MEKNKKSAKNTVKRIIEVIDEKLKQKSRKSCCPGGNKDSGCC